MTDETSVEETKSEKFQRLSSARLERAIKGIQVIENLSSHSYENTTDEAEEIIKQLLAAVGAVAEAFEVEHLMKGGAPSAGLIDQASSEDETTGPVPDGPAETASTPAPAVAVGDTLPADFPTKAEGIELIRVGPIIDTAIGDLNDGNVSAALARLHEVMKA